MRTSGLDWEGMRSTRDATDDVQSDGLELVLPRRAETVAALRSILRRLLREAAFERSDVEEVVLTASELAANAVQYATNGDTYRVTCHVDEAAMELTVSDQGPGFVPGGLVAPDPDQSGGRGLIIVRAAMDEARFEFGVGGATHAWGRKLRTGGPVPGEVATGVAARVSAVVAEFRDTVAALGGSIRQLG